MALRRLDDHLSAMNRVAERLSSGLRINRASDDAAGLAISSSLGIEARIANVARRNVNDGLSVLSIADSALESLGTIVTRQRELAEQAANGTYTLKQRQAMNKELNALVEEFNRVVEGTEFNNVALLAPGASFGIQVGGDGSSRSMIGIDFASDFDRMVGTGQFAAPVNYSTINNRGVAALDVNNDGKLDLIAAPADTQAAIGVLIGNGDGTFKVSVSYASTPGTAGSFDRVSGGDFNGDGAVDILVGRDNSSNSVLLGNGDGTFKAALVLGGGGDSFIADVNNDGELDVVALSTGVNVYLGNGNGTFKAAASSPISASSIALGDINGDGILDLATARSTTGYFAYLGLGNGTFGPSPIATFNSPDGPFWVNLEDFNNDGHLDLVGTEYESNTGTTGSLRLGNGDGSFKAVQTFSTPIGPLTFDSNDMNGDGYLDLVVGTPSNRSAVLFGNGDGTFDAYRTYNAGWTYMLDTGDFNGDGVMDAVNNVNDTSSLAVFLGVGESVTTQQFYNITTQSGARGALTTLEQTAERISLGRAKIGSLQSRLESAGRLLESSRTEMLAAQDRIQSADIATESAEYARRGILARAASSVLAQANLTPSIALTLLRI